ncbi:GATA zinc finger domain-containing protein 15-like [Wyeomyia smithii]|uniref:GATA zinc finger domain-containing protein 15-like n=1 Tax=Wyeomyia smithii TaxID=174621 RepID=UPI002467C385|nr:GATA zinc finger domain-containing protein 15-like [Wyeomyia smithii]
MKVCFIIFSLVALAAADAEVQEPSTVLQPPSEGQQDFHAPWTEQNTWQPIVDPQQPINEEQAGTHDHHPHESYTSNVQYQSQQFQDHNTIESTPSSVAVQVNHPHCATSFTNVNRYDTQWPNSNSVVALSSYHTEQQPAVVDYSNNVALSNPWSGNTEYINNNNNNNLGVNSNLWSDNNNLHHAAVYQHHQPSYGHAYNHYDSASLKHHQPAAKYIAITPGSIHIAPLPGHTVSQKFLNLNQAGTW